MGDGNILAFSKKVSGNMGMVSGLVGCGVSMLVSIYAGKQTSGDKDYIWATFGLSLMAIFGYLATLKTYLWLTFIFYSVCFASGVGTTQVFLNAIVSKMSTSKNQGCALGILHFFKGFASATAPWMMEYCWRISSHHEHCRNHRYNDISADARDNNCCAYNTEWNSQTGEVTLHVDANHSQHKCCKECKIDPNIEGTFFEGNLTSIIGLLAGILAVGFVLWSWKHSKSGKDQEKDETSKE